MTAVDLARAYSALRRFTLREEPHDPCDLCGVPIADRHDHLLEPETRRIACVCRACGLLFPDDAGGRFRRIRSRALPLLNAALNDADFHALGIPVRLFYLCPSRIHQTVFAVYPNTAGATEATVALSDWEALVCGHPALSVVEAEVDGLLCDHLGGRTRCFVASLDVCRHFVGLLGARGSVPEAIRFLDGIDGGIS